jgi:hypothetical protein
MNDPVQFSYSYTPNDPSTKYHLVEYASICIQFFCSCRYKFIFSVLVVRSFATGTSISEWPNSTRWRRSSRVTFQHLPIETCALCAWPRRKSPSTTRRCPRCVVLTETTLYANSPTPMPDTTLSFLKVILFKSKLDQA